MNNDKVHARTLQCLCLAWPGLLNINSVCVLNCIKYISVILYSIAAQ